MRSRSLLIIALAFVPALTIAVGQGCGRFSTAPLTQQSLTSLDDDKLGNELGGNANGGTADGDGGANDGGNGSGLDGGGATDGNNNGGGDDGGTRPAPRPTPTPAPTPSATATPQPISYPNPPGSMSFTVFYNFTFTNMPSATEFAKCGLFRMPLITHTPLFGQKSPPENAVPTDYLKNEASAYIVANRNHLHSFASVDIEGSWDIKLDDSTNEAKRKISLYEGAIDALHAGLKQHGAIGQQMKIGLYGVVPQKEVRAFTHNDAGRLKKFNQLIPLLKNLGNKVDMFNPVLYVFYDDLPAWKRHAEGQINAAKPFKKPIFPYIWMQFHDRASASLATKLLPAGMFRNQLDYLKSQGVPGTIIWGTTIGKADGKNVRLEWNQNHAWWKETKQFLKDMKYDLSQCRL